MGERKYKADLYLKNQNSVPKERGERNKSQ